MPVIRRSLLVILGITTMIVTLFLATVPKYSKMKRVINSINMDIPKLEEAYDRYVKQLKALEDLKKVLKNPPDMRSDVFNGLNVVKKGNVIYISGVVDGKRFVKILDYFSRNPNSYVKRLSLSNYIENPMVISRPSESKAFIKMEVQILGLRK